MLVYEAVSVPFGPRAAKLAWPAIGRVGKRPNRVRSRPMRVASAGPAWLGWATSPGCGLIGGERLPRHGTSTNGNVGGAECQLRCFAAIQGSEVMSANGVRLTTHEVPRPVEIFVSYSHADESHLKRLWTHLAPLRREGLISVWYDKMIEPGERWPQEIEHRVSSAEIVLLLVSPDFVASDYCFTRELDIALKRHENGSALVIPIFVRHSDVSGLPLAGIQGLPHDARPVSAWSDPDEAWTDVVKGIRRAVLRMKSADPLAPNVSASDSSALPSAESLQPTAALAKAPNGKAAARVMLALLGVGMVALVSGIGYSLGPGGSQGLSQAASAPASGIDSGDIAPTTEQTDIDASLSMRQSTPPADTNIPNGHVPVGTRARFLPAARAKRSNLDPDYRTMVETTIGRHYDEIRNGCCRQVSCADVGATGEMVVAFEIAASGRVRAARHEGGTIHSASFVQCVLRSVEGLSFPSHGSSSAQFSYPFRF